MTNAAIYLHPDGYDTTRAKLLGRHAAGESFLRGFLRHAKVDRYHFWNVTGAPIPELETLVNRIHPPEKPVRWIGRTDRPGLREAGVLNLPHPGLSDEAWLRRFSGTAAYSLCAITHTTATANVMRQVPEMLISPTEAHDALICTSSAVRRSLETQMDMAREYLEHEHGRRLRAEPMRVTIPLGVNVDDFAPSPEHRKAWRERLDIPEDAVVALYVGRFNVREKMNPALMALALEKAAVATGQPIYWVNSGWAHSPEETKAFHDQTKVLCPSVHYRDVDGRPADVRFSIWSVADFFISFSDNIQETFGLTPIEAMAAGLPCVVTDWNGYKDTVRHGEDGFRIPTVTARPGDGLDLAYYFESGWMTYTNYVAAASQYMAIDFAESTAAISALVMNKDLRLKLGKQAQARARDVFDWAAIVPQYQLLWAEQNAKRTAQKFHPLKSENPFRPDPFTLFGNYPTHHLQTNWRVDLAPGMTWEAAEALLSNPLASYSPFNRPSLAEVQQVIAWLDGRPGATVKDVLDAMPAGRRSFIQRGLLWVARYGVITLRPPA